MNNDRCGVCGNQGHGLHFGIIACRACSSFFRRSIAEQKTYKCRLKNQCLIKNDLRNQCRACRFQKCIESGMKTDGKQKEPDTRNNSSLPSSINNIGENTIFHRSCTRFNVLVEGIYNYKASEKSLFTVNHPDQIFNSLKEFEIVSEDKYPEILKGSISLLFSMFNECYPFFRNTTQINKLKIIKSMYHEFHALYMGIQTCHYFTEADKKLFAHYGYCMPYDFSGFFKKPNLTVNKLLEPMMEIIILMIRKIRALKLMEADLAVLCAIIVCDHAATLGISANDIQEFRQEILADYNYQSLMTYGASESGIRIANVFCLLSDAKCIALKIDEFHSIAKIFITEFSDHWEQAVGQVP